MRWGCLTVNKATFKTRILFVVAIIVALASISGILMLRSVAGNYSDVVDYFGTTQGYVGSLLSAFARMDTIVRAEDSNGVESLSADVDTCFAAVENTITTGASRTDLSKAKEAWDRYKQTALHMLALEGSGQESNAESQTVDSTYDAQTTKRDDDTSEKAGLTAQLTECSADIYEGMQAILMEKSAQVDAAKAQVNMLSIICIVILAAAVITAFAVALTKRKSSSNKPQPAVSEAGTGIFH